MIKERKSRAFNPRCESPRQGISAGFEHPFDRESDRSNRWIVLSHSIPWDELCGVYLKQSGHRDSGREPINPRIVLRALIIKYLYKSDDRETADRISGNICMRYFPGYPSFTSEKPFDASLFGDIRKRLGMDSVNAINEKIVVHPTDLDLLSEAREISEGMTDRIYKSHLHGEKPRTCRQTARKEYLHTAQKKKKIESISM